MKRLYTPFKVNKLELKNRVIMSPMSIGHTVDGCGETGYLRNAG